MHQQTFENVLRIKQEEYSAFEILFRFQLTQLFFEQDKVLAQLVVLAKKNLSRAANRSLGSLAIERNQQALFISHVGEEFGLISVQRGGGGFEIQAQQRALMLKKQFVKPLVQRQ